MDASALSRLTIVTLALGALMLPPAAVGKSTRELRIGRSVAIQANFIRAAPFRTPTLAPRIFGGRAYLDVGRYRPIKAGQAYRIAVVFRRGLREGAQPQLLLRNLDTAEGERIPAKGRSCPRGEFDEFGFPGPRWCYYHVDLRFPSAGRWSLAIEDGTGETLEFADGRMAPILGPRGSVSVDRVPYELLEAGRSYPITATFLDRSTRPSGDPIVAIREPETGERWWFFGALDGERGRDLTYRFDLRFPNAGTWAMALDDGTGSRLRPGNRVGLGTRTVTGPETASGSAPVLRWIGLAALGLVIATALGTAARRRHARNRLARVAERAG